MESIGGDTQLRIVLTRDQHTAVDLATELAEISAKL